MKNESDVTRRRLLQAAGLASGTLFLPSLLGDKVAHAATPAKRILFLLTMHGPPTKYWKMRRPGLPDEGADWEFPLDDPNPASFSEVLRDLHPHRKDLLILEGLSLTSGVHDEARNNHGQAMLHNLTGALGGAGPSVDQIIADKVAVPGRFKHLYYGSNWGVAGTWSSDMTGKRVPNGESIYVGNAINRIFGGLGSKPMAGPPTPAERQNQLLAFVKGRYDALMPKLGSEDRQKVARHRAMLADLESQLATLTQVRCETPAGSGNESDMAKQAQLFLSKIYPTAMACDLTRVAMFHHFGYNNASWFGGPASIPNGDIHAQIAHNGEDGGSRVDLMRDYYKLHTREFLGAIEALKSVPEGNGTMLDNTILVWFPELGNGIHDYWNMKVVLAGGRSALRTGRYIRYGNTRPNPYPSYHPGTNFGSKNGAALGMPHNRLLVSLMQAMGVERNSIGLTQSAGMSVQKGVPIDLTGPLPGLAV